jgi:cytochrome c
MIRTITAGALLAAAVSVSAFAADPAAGQKVFKSQCSICHSVAQGKNMTGPSLFGIVGRPAGTVEGFHYSAANKKSGLTWDEATLEKYLPNPKAAVPGTSMTYPGLKNDAQRADLIAYLATLH